MSAGRSSLPRRIPYAGIWIDNYSLTAVPGGALLAGGIEWHPDGIGSRSQTTGGAAFWDASAEAWHPLAPLPSPRHDHAAVTLPDGRALLIGGRADQIMEMHSTLLWDPRTQAFQEGPPLREARARPVAVTLPDGAVLVLGSEYDDDLERGTRAELLRPGARAWEAAGQTARIFHTGPVCVSGSQVVIAGGRDNGFGFAIIDGTHYAPPLSRTTELWESERRLWRTSGPLMESRDEAQGVTLSEERILVVGGWDQGQLLATAEVWEPGTGTWSAAGTLASARSSFALTALPDGRAVVSGGLVTGTSEPTAVAEIWNPETRTWSLGKPLAVPRAGHRLAAVGAGTFLVVGNHAPSPEAPPETSWELWRPDA
ncbi:Kelch motif-containing protein [Stigmatella aurantiaca]|uniref:Kelch motif-containing protein n=1 Tax=Stigmatella aurantiaca TaxID=41 RepID=A0A1H7SPF7_STIAU|nr:kelch motif-containing protein [Stigmatella aurantiaca]SEL73976.1 Kelch motif-containing protein [Stigmatella aurantiaca]